MSENIDVLDYERGPDTTIGKRPVFITVLCILSWMGSVVYALYAIYMFNLTVSMKEVYESMAQSLANSPGMEDIYSEWTSRGKYAYLLLYVNLGCLLLEVVSLIF